MRCCIRKAAQNVPDREPQALSAATARTVEQAEQLFMERLPDTGVAL
jgi:hypothetical protein